MASGVKVKGIKTRNAYTIESFYEAIKNKSFTAGTPSLTKHGMATIVTFPAQDSRNQVWILKSGFGEESKKFSVQKSEEAGAANMAGNMALDAVTKGAFGFGKVVGSNSKKCEQLVDATAKELEALGL